ncbi:hypothetical protein ACFWY9_40455 [Amycolatopsis sp. NPDC059027]|uniref:hypothetical protein n=1 Tax=unclassified Amycolatopsis TaxID=2618356 RepID=UPI00366FF41D
MRKFFVTLAALASAFLLLGTGVASAGWHGDYIGQGIRIRSVPDGGTVKGLGYQGQGQCSTVARKVGSYWWGYHRNDTTGVVGWSRGDYLSVDGRGC